MRYRRIVGNGRAIRYAWDREEVDRASGIHATMCIVIRPRLCVRVRVRPFWIVHVRRTTLWLGRGRRGLQGFPLGLTLLVSLMVSRCRRLTVRLWLHL